MIDDALARALNEQINQEFTAAYQYLAMAAWFDGRNLDGFARWMELQHTEELEHGKRLYRYLLDRGGLITLAPIERPVGEFDASLDVFRHALEQEQGNTRSINALYDLATRVNDHATKSHLQWFLDEQVEEEKSIEEIIGLLELAQGDNSALLYLNDKLGARKSGESDPGAS